MKPTASPPCFPFPAHRTMAEVMRDEAKALRIAAAFELDEDPEICGRLERAAMFRSNTRFVAALTTFLEARA